MAADPHAKPSTESDEPQTPLWLTWLGGALFLLGAIYLLATADPAEPAAAEAPSAPAAAALQH
ncbi:MAG TPA: hypothetical protein VLC09_02670 [Polyangiaceae bacterium]|nr:hypothetical protein [Polyangiaceae bacterium]